MKEYDILMKSFSDEIRNNLIDFVYESEEKLGLSGDDVSIIGFYPNEYLPEYINEETLDKINFGGKIKFAVIELRNKEGWEKPHLHITNSKINIAIRLDVPEYFIHPHAKDTFTNNKQKKMFDEFMRSNIPGTSITRWQYSVAAFNLHNNDHIIGVEEQPDYTKLP